MDVSIIIPVYNAKNFIADCMKSVVEQTFLGNIECILVDDCGQDNSIDLAQEFIESYSRENIIFKILHQDHNQGPSAARNRGISEATGDYIFFLDSDDKITPNCIGSLYARAKEYNLDYVQGSYKGDKNKFANTQILDINCLILDRKIIKRTLLNYNLIPFTPHNRLVRRQMLLEHNLFFNEDIRVREDFLWMSFVAKYVERFGYYPETTYVRGYNEDSLTHNVNIEREIKGYRVLIETMCNNLDTFQIGHQKELILSALIMCLNAQYYHNNNERESLIKIVNSKNNIIERLLVKLYFKIERNFLEPKVLHLLIRLYKIND